MYSFTIFQVLVIIFPFSLSLRVYLSVSFSLSLSEKHSKHDHKIVQNVTIKTIDFSISTETPKAYRLVK